MTYNLTKLGIQSLNPMQQEMLQVARKESHLVLLSPTGSGKTLAYLLPTIEKISEDNQALQALVLVPSRELALQTQDVVKSICPALCSMACYGGRPTMDEHRIMNGMHPRLIIATPGRMLDHIQKNNIGVDQVEHLIIDEFDKSLELGFQTQMEAIISVLPSVRTRILLSATDNPQIPRFVGSLQFTKRSYLISDEQIPDTIRLCQVLSPEKDKLQTLYRLLCTLGTQKSLVFVNYRQSVERVGDYLHSMGISSGTFHGGMEQKDRERALYRFINGSSAVFVSTDLASRGLDISDIDNVIHYHLPLDEDAYIHRNGRTARWDKAGTAYLILSPEEHLPEYIQGNVEHVDLPQRVPAPVQPLWVTLYIGKGKKDKLSKSDIVGFLTKVGGLEGNQLGRIDVLPGWSFAAVDRSCVKALLRHVNGQKIKGMKTIFAVSD